MYIMKLLNKLSKEMNAYHIFIGFLLVVYIVSNVNMPYDVRRFVDTSIGNIIVIILAVLLLLTTHPIVGILGVVAAYELIRRSSNPNDSLNTFYPENIDIKQNHIPVIDRAQLYPDYNKFPITLEQETVQRMVPLVSNNSVSKFDYRPVMHDTHNASSL